MDDPDSFEDDEELPSDRLRLADILGGKLDDDKLLALHELVFEPRKLPEELEELQLGIRDFVVKRRVVPGATDTYPFEGYEAIDVRTGGMGMVIEARDPELDRKVAIKLWARVDPKATEALLAEAKTLAKLSHPNVVRVYGTGRWKNRVYFVMEWVEGQDGRAWQKQRPGWREVRDAFVQAGEGLAAAHDAGIQHRDFKPSNMLVGDDGRVLVADFGVAASLGVDVEVPQPDERRGRGSGTLTYMAPERLRGGAGDARSDQFSFCVSLWQGLHGFRPFVGSSTDDLLDAIEAGMVMPGYPDIDAPHWLSRVVRRGLESDPERRWPDMRELLRALQDEPPEQEKADEGDGELAERPEGVVMHSPASAPEPDRNWRLFRYVGLTTMVLGMGILVGLAIPGQDGPPPEPPPKLSTPPATPSEATLALPDRVLAQVGQSCRLAHGTRLYDEEQFWRECEKELEELSDLWDTGSIQRELHGVPTYPDSIRIGVAFLEKARALLAWGATHACDITPKGQLRCHAEAHPAEVANATDLHLLPNQLRAIEKAAFYTTYWANAAAADLRRHGEPEEAASPLTDEIRDFRTNLRFISASQNK